MNGGGSKGWLAGLIVAAVLVGGGVLIYKNMKTGDSEKPDDTGRDAPLIDPDKTIAKDTVVDVPFIFWGGDVATFHANGGLETRPDSLFGKHGIKCRLTPGDDFDKQIETYLAGKSPFLRGTLSMLGQASEKLTAKPGTMPVVFLQLTWSAGDHLVGREAITKLDQLKGKKIALQEGGPHVGVLNDILHTARLDWNDITVVWTKDVSGDKGPAELFRKDKSLDACFVISPEMFELTSAPDSGGVESVGDGTKKSVKGAHVVVSTAHMSRSIADVYACRKDFYDNNREWIDKFVAGYLKACEDLVDVKKKAQGDDKAAEKRYKDIVTLAQDIWGKDPAFKDAVAKFEDVDGLISDSNFVGLPGNESFFKAKGNLSGIDFKQKQALRLPADPSKDKPKSNPKLFQAANLDYVALRKLGDLHGKAPTQARIAAEKIKVEPEQIIFSFEISFEANQSTFDETKYGADYQRALELASLYGNTAVAVRGHADPCLLVQRFLKASQDKGLIRAKGNGFVVVAGDKAFDPHNMKEVLDFIKDNPGLEFGERGERFTVSEAVASLQDLSVKRSEEVKKTVATYAANHSLLLDKSQFRADAVGVRDPKKVLIKPGEGYDSNRRVEFSIIKVPLKDVNSDEFDL